MPSIAITGSYGSGKSLAATLLMRRLESMNIPATSYSADSHNSLLLEQDPVVRMKLIKRFGPYILDASGIPDRSKLGEIIRNDDVARKDLEEIMHPLLRDKWLPECLTMRGQSGAFFIAEIPLLFESNLTGHFDSSVTVGCSAAIRRKRASESRGMDPAVIDRWVSMQLPESDKALLADHLIWNDGPMETLSLQINLLAEMLIAA